MSIHIELDEGIDYYEYWDIATRYEQTVTMMIDLAHLSWKGRVWSNTASNVYVSAW